jgi:hypothetical protein
MADPQTPARVKAAPAGWKAGLVAARANLLPGLFIQAAMLGVLAAYYHWDAARAFLTTVAAWKQHYSYGFTVVVTALAGAILPEIFRVATFQGGSWRRQNLANLLFGIPLWGLMGASVDAFYRAQAMWFGSGVTPLILLKKVAVDQFIYTPLWGTPAIVLAYEWKRRRLATRGLGSLFAPAFWKSAVLPAVIAGWGVWIPAVSIVYSLPLPLQIPLFALAECFWSLLLTYMVSERPALYEPPPGELSKPEPATAV